MLPTFLRTNHNKVFIKFIGTKSCYDNYLCLSYCLYVLLDGAVFWVLDPLELVELWRCAVGNGGENSGEV